MTAPTLTPATFDLHDAIHALHAAYRRAVAMLAAGDVRNAVAIATPTACVHVFAMDDLRDGPARVCVTVEVHGRGPALAFAGRSMEAALDAWFASDAGVLRMLAATEGR